MDNKPSLSSFPLAPPFEEDTLDKADEELIRYLKEAGQDLLKYAQQLKDLKKQREITRNKIHQLEKGNEDKYQELKEIRIKTFSLHREKEDANAALQNEKKNVKALEEEIQHQRDHLQDYQQRDAHLEEQLKEIEKSKFDPLYQNEYARLLLEDSPVCFEDSSSLEENPSSLEKSLKIQEFLDLQKVNPDEELERITQKADQALNSILSSLKKVIDNYKVKETLVQEREKIIQEMKEQQTALEEKERQYQTKKTFIAKVEDDWKSKKEGLEKAVAQEKSLEEALAQQSREILSLQRTLERLHLNRRSLLQEFKRVDLIQAITPLLIEKSDHFEEILSPDAKAFLSPVSSTDILKDDDQEKPNLKIKGFEEPQLEEPFSQFYRGFEYEGVSFLVLDGLAFIEYLENFVGEVVDLEERNRRSLSNPEEAFQWGKTKRQLNIKQIKLVQILEDLVFSYNFGLQKKLFAYAHQQQEGKEQSYDLLEKNLIFDEQLTPLILRILKKLLYTPSELPSQNTFIELKGYFAQDGNIETRFDGEEGLALLRDVKELCTEHRITFFQDEAFRSKHDYSLKKQISYLAQIVKSDLVNETSETVSPLSLPPHPQEKK